MPKAALLNSADSSQKTIMARKNALNKGMFITRIKNKLENNNLQVKPISRALFANAENKENEAPSPDQKNQSEVMAMISRSKKIGKPMENQPLPPPRMALGDVTHSYMGNNRIPVDQDPNRKMQVAVQGAMQGAGAYKKTPHFLEDKGNFTSNYITLNYMNPKSRKVFSFRCYQDKELNYPQHYAEKTIAHSCDNDCTTDEDQIRGAKRNLQKAMETYLKEQKEMDAKLNEHK